MAINKIGIVSLIIGIGVGSFCDLSWGFSFPCYYHINYVLEYGFEDNSEDYFERDADSNYDISSSRSLQEVIKKGDIARCRRLLKNGVDISQENEIGGLLHDTIFWEQEEIFRLLIKYKANINAKDSKGNTALHEAIWFNKKGIFTLLLKHNANVNEKDNNGYTPLHIAYMIGYKEYAELLMQYGAHILTDHSGKTPFEVTSNPEITKSILAYEALKITGYLAKIKPRQKIPEVVVCLILCFSSGKKI